MTTQRNRAAKKLKVNLNYLRNDLDIWHHRLISWLDGKSQPQQNEIEKFGIEVVQKLCKREILKKKDIYGMKFPERPLTPRRSRSDSPNRPTTPSDCQKKLDFNDDEDSYKVEADISHASCTCANNEVYYKCRISLLEKQKVELEKELQRTAKNEDFELSANDKHIDGCPKCTFLVGHTQRYRAERNELREDNHRLENMLTRLTGERNDHGRKLRMLEYEKAKLAENNKSLETHISKNAEEDETLGLKTRSYENTIQNQKKLIFEMQKRNEEQKIALKDAEGALEQHILMLEICRTEKNDAESMLSGYLIKNDSGQRQYEIAQLQKNLQKQKQKADEQIHNLKKILHEKENDLQQGTKRFNEIIEKMKEMEIQRKDMSSRDRNELLDEKKSNRKLVKDNESLKDKIYEIENIHAEEKKKQIDIENKLQHQVKNLKIQNSRTDKKVTNAEKELEEMSVKCKEQQSIFDSKRCQLESEIKELILQLDDMRKSTEYRWLSEEGNDQTLEQIGKGSIIRAQTMINYDLLLAEKSEEVTKKVSELYEDKWEVAMIELGENGGKEKNIEFLLKILENAYSFCECLEGRFTDEFEQAMVKAAANIKEVVDTTVFVRLILERLERCIIQLFFRQYSQYQEYRTKEPVYSYITEALSLSWFMVTRNPRVSISTTIPDESHLQFYDTYSTDGSEVDYVVLPMITWSTNKREIIRKGIAAFK